MRSLPSGFLCTVAALLLFAVPAAAEEAAPSPEVPCSVRIEAQLASTPANLVPIPEVSPAPPAISSEPGQQNKEEELLAWLADQNGSGSIQSACCCGITYTETMSVSCGSGACRYERTCATCYGCGSWRLVSMGGCGGCPTP